VCKVMTSDTKAGPERSAGRRARGKASCGRDRTESVKKKTAPVIADHACHKPPGGWLLLLWHGIYAQNPRSEAYGWVIGRAKPCS
jgi:hypothetical protein